MAVSPLSANSKRDEAPVALHWIALGTLFGFAAYRFFHLAVYPISLGERGADFSTFYAAAESILHGASLYTDPGGLNTFIYPPTLAVLLVPLALLQLNDPYPVFLALACAALVASVGMLARFAPHQRSQLAVTLGLVTLAAWPAHLLLRQGQVDSLTLVLMVGALSLMWRERPHWAALALGAAISLKVTPAVLLVYLAWKRQYRLAAESLAAAGAIVVVTALPVGIGELGTYVTRVLPRIGSEGNGYWYNQSLHAVFLRLFSETNFTRPAIELGTGAAVAATAIAGAALLAATLSALPRTRTSSPAVFLGEAGAFIVLEMLGSSLSWQMHAVWLLVPLTALIIASLERSPARRLPLLAIVGTLGFIAGPYEPPFEYGRFTNGWATLLMSHTVAADLFLFGACLYVVGASRPLRLSAARAVVLSPIAAMVTCAFVAWQLVAGVPRSVSPTHELNPPHAAAAIEDVGTIYVADTANDRIQKLSPSGEVLAQWGRHGADYGEFDQPSGVAVDSRGNVYVADTFNHRIQKFSSAGQPLRVWGSFGSGRAQFNTPRGIALDASGNVFVADSDNHRVQEFTSSGQPLGMWGTWGASRVALFSPADLAIDADGNLVVVDAGSNTVKTFTPGGKFVAQTGIDAFSLATWRVN